MVRHGVIAERVAARADLAEQPRILGRGVAGHEERRVLVGAREHAQDAQRVGRRPVVERERDHPGAAAGMRDREAGRDLREHAIIDPGSGGRSAGSRVVRLHGHLEDRERRQSGLCDQRARLALEHAASIEHAERRDRHEGGSEQGGDPPLTALPAPRQRTTGLEWLGPRHAGMVRVATARAGLTRLPSAWTFRPWSADGDHRRRGRRIG